MLQQLKRSGLVLVCLAGWAAAAAQDAPLNIKQSIDMAFANNRSLRADSINISIAESRNRETAALYRPQMNYSSSNEYNPAIPSQMLPGSMVGQPSKELVPVEFGSKYQWKSGIEITQTIYRKDLQLQIRNAGLYTDIAKTKHNLTREGLVYQVASTFYGLQASAELIRTTRRDYQNMKEVVAIAKAQYENGILKRIDFESLQINVANTESYLEQLQTQYNDQLAYFNYLLGVPAASQTAIDSSIASNLPSAETNRNLLQREDIRLSYQLIESKQKDMNIIRAEKKPVINSYFRYGYQSQYNDISKAFNSDNVNNSSTVGVAVSVSILDGKRRKHRLNTAQLQLDQLKLESQNKQEQAQMELVSASGSLGNYQTQYQITRDNLVLATNVFNARKALYAEGVTTLMELLDAESELSQARNLHIQSLINLQTGKLELHKANGTLLTDFIKAL